MRLKMFVIRIVSICFIYPCFAFGFWPFSMTEGELIQNLKEVKLEILPSIVNLDKGDRPEIKVASRKRLNYIKDVLPSIYVCVYKVKDEKGNKINLHMDATEIYHEGGNQDLTKSPIILKFDKDFQRSSNRVGYPSAEGDHRACPIILTPGVYRVLVEIRIAIQDNKNQHYVDFTERTVYYYRTKYFVVNKAEPKLDEKLFDKDLEINALTIGRGYILPELNEKEKFVWRFWVNKPVNMDLKFRSDSNDDKDYLVLKERIEDIKPDKEYNFEWNGWLNKEEYEKIIKKFKVPLDPVGKEKNIIVGQFYLDLSSNDEKGRDHILAKMLIDVQPLSRYKESIEMKKRMEGGK